MPIELRNRVIPNTENVTAPSDAVSTTTDGAATTPAKSTTRRSRRSSTPESATSQETISSLQKLSAWAVHFYTGLGLPLNLMSVHALYYRHDFVRFCLLNIIAVIVDATDGTFARKVDVKKVTPNFDGAALDNIVDYLTFAFLPALAIVAFKLVPNQNLQLILASLSIVASGYQFCQTVAKTSESFVGFPSYWNIVLFYMYYLRPPVLVVVAVYVACSVLSFIPIHFIYPSKTKKCQALTLGLGCAWGIMMLPIVIAPKWQYAMVSLKASLLYVVYYVALSLKFHFEEEKR